MVKIDFDRQGLDIAWGATHKYWDVFPEDSATNGAEEDADALANRIELQRGLEGVALMTVMAVQELLMVAGADALAKQKYSELDREVEDVKPISATSDQGLETAEGADVPAEQNNCELDCEIEQVQLVTALSDQDLTIAEEADAFAKQSLAEPHREFEDMELPPGLSEQELIKLIVPDLGKRLLEDGSQDDQELIEQSKYSEFEDVELMRDLSEQELMKLIVTDLDQRLMAECAQDDLEIIEQARDCESEGVELMPDLSEQELMKLIVPDLDQRLMEECSQGDPEITEQARDRELEGGELMPDLSEQELMKLIVPDFDKRLMEECSEDDQDIIEEIIEQARKRTKKQESPQHQQAIEATTPNQSQQAIEPVTPNQSCWSFFKGLFQPMSGFTEKSALKRPLLAAADSDLEQALLESAFLVEAKEVSIATARVRLQGVMEMFKAKARPVEADGNCQFRALALQLHGDEGEHAEVRSATVEWLKNMQERYCDFVHEPYEDYLSRMACNGEWGDNVTLQAASDMLHRDIHILNDQPGAERVSVHPTHKVDSVPEKPLWLAFIAEMHYDAVEFE